MDPVFTLQWSEFVLAERLLSKLPKSKGYSVWVPMSRQEKGIDLAVLKRGADGTTRTVTIQIKASRAYRTEEPKRKTTQRHAFQTWFNRFPVPDDADFFLLFVQYAPDIDRTRRVGPRWYKDMTLLFTKEEMKKLISNCKTVNGGDDKMFGFGFNDEFSIVQVRGDKNRAQEDFTDKLLSTRLNILCEALQGEMPPSPNIDPPPENQAFCS